MSDLSPSIKPPQHVPSQMKLNIFSISLDQVKPLKDKLTLVGLNCIHEEFQDEWKTSFYFSKDEEPHPISWVKNFPKIFKQEFKNLIYFGAYIFEKNETCYLLSFGKAHFYIRPFCDRDFGIEVAKRIANEEDIRQTASKRFAGKKKKEIKSYTQNTRLDVESGEAVDYVQSSIHVDRQNIFGKNGKFAESILITPSINEKDLSYLFDEINALLHESPKFKLPRTEVISELEEITKYDNHLLEAIKTCKNTLDFTETGHDVVGVDFVFSGHQNYTLQCKRYPPKTCDNLTPYELLTYIKTNSLSDSEIFEIKIKTENEGQKSYQRELKATLDYTIDHENVTLSNGSWLRFNEDYMEQLNEYVDSILIEDTEARFATFSGGEPEFNTSKELMTAGYISADKDFSHITVCSTPTEAWDQRKGNTGYAIKFGSAQQLSYVCSQARSVIEILRNKANLKKLDTPINAYCIWLFFETKNIPTKISENKSIILRQQIEAWARACRNINIEPRLKFSRKIK